MTFDDWAEEKDFWKTRTHEAFSELWDALASSGRKGYEITNLLDRVWSAAQDEFGG
jgi:hypothetical protein